MSRGRAELGGAVREGAGETRSRLDGLPRRLLAMLDRALLAGFGIFFDLLALVINLLLALLGFLRGPGRRIVSKLGLGVAAAARALTPARALALATAGAAVLLALSQFADYRGVSIGVESYAGVMSVAPAPVVERSPTGSAHFYAMVPVAVVSLLLLVAALRGRWRLCRLVALGGIAAIVVAVVIDRPAGLDPGEAAFSFEGVEASLLGGFYAQIAAGALLTVGALLLGRELRIAGSPQPRRAGARANRIEARPSQQSVGA